MSTQPEFDYFADTYDDDLNQALSATGESKEYFARGRVQWLARCLARLQEKPQAVLDYGCGIGDTARLFQEYLKAATIVGIDISERSIAHAKARYGSKNCHFTTFANYTPRQSIDLVYCNGVFHHIPLLQRASALDYICRSLRPGGVFALWENNAWNPGTRFVMSRCKFDCDAITLTPRQAVDLVAGGGLEVIGVDYQFVFPSLLKGIRFLEPWFSRIPLGAQYQVLCRKPSA
jgi:trans-aconitate methyltransferase